MKIPKPIGDRLHRLQPVLFSSDEAPLPRYLLWYWDDNYPCQFCYYTRLHVAGVVIGFLLGMLVLALVLAV